jgi:hypothetical protein
MTSTEVVGPVNVIRFGRREHHISVNYTPPSDTCDPRWDACHDHHVACDCREAEMSEDRHEWAYERKEIREAVDTILAGHPTYTHGAPNPYTGEVDPPCQCTGCQLARAIHVYPRGT